MPWAHNREYYRVAYPTQARPRLMVQGHTFDVVDISERGIRFKLLDSVPPPGVGNEVRGTVRFRRGDTVDVRGTVLRLDGREVAMHLDDGIPLRVVMEEQRFLLDRHRNLGM